MFNTLSCMTLWVQLTITLVQRKEKVNTTEIPIHFYKIIDYVLLDSAFTFEFHKRGVTLSRYFLRCSILAVWSLLRHTQRKKRSPRWAKDRPTTGAKSDSRTTNESRMWKLTDGRHGIYMIERTQYHINLNQIDINNLYLDSDLCDKIKPYKMHTQLNHCMGSIERVWPRGRNPAFTMWASSWATMTATNRWVPAVVTLGLYNMYWVRYVIKPQFSIAPAPKSGMAIWSA